MSDASHSMPFPAERLDATVGDPASENIGMDAIHPGYGIIDTQCESYAECVSESGTGTDFFSADFTLSVLGRGNSRLYSSCRNIAS